MRLQTQNEGAIDGNDVDGRAGEAGNAANGQGDKDKMNEMNLGQIKRLKKKSKGKKWKALTNDFTQILMKFLVFIVLIEAYFIANYLLSVKFMENSISLTLEYRLIVQKESSHRFLQLLQTETFYSNGTSIILGNPVENQIDSMHVSMQDREEELLDLFAKNYDFHSAGYNENFNNLVYASICDNLPELSQNETLRNDCQYFNQGILKKGMYSTAIKFIDYLRQLQHDFIESKRT